MGYGAMDLWDNEHSEQRVYGTICLLSNGRLG